MTSQEHTIAVVEPSLDGESTIKYARQAADRGERASVVVLLGPETKDSIAAFAKAENLTLPDGWEIYMERLAENFSTLFNGKENVTIVTDGPDASRVVFERASREAATSLVVPQRLVTRRKWKSSVAKSGIAVLVAPPKAA